VRERRENQNDGQSVQIFHGPPPFSAMLTPAETGHSQLRRRT